MKLLPINVPNMSILSHYVKKNAFFAISVAVLGLWLLQIIFSYLSELDKLSNDYTMIDALRYIAYRSPHFLVLFIPSGALLGAVIGLGLLANKNELVVMRASGVSIYRIVIWVLQPAMLFVLLSLAMNQFVLPISNQQAEQVTSSRNDTSNLVSSVSGYWTVQPHYANRLVDNSPIIGKDILYIDYVDTNGNLGQVKRWRLDNQGNLQSAIQAKSGTYLSKVENHTHYQYQWLLHDITELTLNQTLTTNQKQLPQDILALPFAPNSVYLLTRKPADLSLTQLYDHRQLMRQQQKRSLEYELAFWQKLLSPLSVLSLVIIACSFVFGSLRSHSLGLRIVVAVLFGLLFSYIQDLVGFVALATGFSPLLMVLLPIVASAGLGLYLLKRQM